MSPAALLDDFSGTPAPLKQKLRELFEVAGPLLHETDDAERAAEGNDTIRGLSLRKRRARGRTVPALRTAATRDMRTEDDAEPREVDIPSEFAAATMAFEVRGESMVGEGIRSLDIVFAREPKNLDDASGEIVVCLVEGYRHLKRLEFRKGKIRLLSAARGHKIWTFDPRSHDLRVLGIVIGRSGPVGRAGGHRRHSSD